MITLDTINHWLDIPKENEHIEFKEANLQYDGTKLLELGLKCFNVNLYN